MLAQSDLLVATRQKVADPHGGGVWQSNVPQFVHKTVRNGVECRVIVHRQKLEILIRTARWTLQSLSTRPGRPSGPQLHSLQHVPSFILLHSECEAAVGCKV
ncbi:hypothetical protein AMECASPLE_038126 [Ameca splendens]|uniref:Uncharacterized protein n=1 Tax=Ameca splendens TaxID=208324 RepID=A0ABV0YKH2_9TELE